MSKKFRHSGLILWIVLLLLFSSYSMVSSAEVALTLPALTETDCVWDEKGNLVSETAHDLNGQPALNTRGFYRAEYTWDDRGNQLTAAYYGLNGEPVTADRGYARMERTWFRDSSGTSHLLTEDRYAPDGSRAEIPGSYSYRRDVWEGDQILSSKYYNAAGELTRPTGGYAQILYDITEKDNTVTVVKRYCDVDGSLLRGSEGGMQVVSVYAREPLEQGDNSIVSEIRSGLKHTFTYSLGPSAIARGAEKQAFRRVQDERHMLLSQEICDADGLPVLGKDHAYRQENTYDERNNLIRVDYTGLDGQPIIASAGYASVIVEYDELDRPISVEYRGLDGERIKLTDG